MHGKVNFYNTINTVMPIITQQTSKSSHPDNLMKITLLCKNILLRASQKVENPAHALPVPTCLGKRPQVEQSRRVSVRTRLWGRKTQHCGCIL